MINRDYTGIGREVKNGDGQYFELNVEMEKRGFKKIRISQNYGGRFGDRNFTSTCWKADYLHSKDPGFFRMF